MVEEKRMVYQKQVSVKVYKGKLGEIVVLRIVGPVIKENVVSEVGVAQGHNVLQERVTNHFFLRHVKAKPTFLFVQLEPRGRGGCTAIAYG